ncbi:RNA-binding protein [Ancylobacter sp. Lp-2]|uniref:RNA-binding protein n=1 Tax=Ancylobacter sp. Lp-2 TaxID=2881339 RepID=UPI001E44D3DE|nr:RNA-binding protein [Ancylobacter sp. Lp-2]MCB4767463.1 RNA-binding protein [Ancylobacter sp. Lp-2]
MQQAGDQDGRHDLPTDDLPVGGAEETDAGPAAARRELSRLCLASRTVRPVDEMLRFVVAPDGQVVPDLAAKLPGRGAWVGATRSELALAVKKKAFGRAFRGKGRVDPGLADLVDALLEKDVFSALSFANKAGRLVTGTTKVAEALQGGAAILVHASDAARDGVAKLDALARRVGEAEGKKIAFVNSLSGVQLDLALGRANVVHAALLAHPTSAGFLARVRRLESWRAG